MNSIEYARVDAAGLTPGCVLIEDDHTVYFVIGLADNHIHVIVIGRPEVCPSFENFPACPVFSHECRFLYDPRWRRINEYQGK